MAGVIDHPFFEGIDASAVTRVLQRRHVATMSVLFRQGDLADAVFFVVSGRIGVDVRLPGGRISRLAKLGPGTVVGEFGLMSPTHRRTGTVVALEPSEMLVMQRRDLEALCRHCNPASLTILQRLMTQACTSIYDLNEERSALARAPKATVPGRSAVPRAGADFPVERHLRILPFREGFADEELDLLVSLSRPWTCDAGGAALYRAGESGGAIWLVVRGSAELSVETPHGPRRMAVVGPGQAFVDPGAFACRAERVIAVGREGATLIELTPEAAAGLYDPKQQISYPFCWSLTRCLMERLVVDTRAVAHEWRVAARGKEKLLAENPSHSGLFRIVVD